MMRTGNFSVNNPVPRYAWVSRPDGLIIAASSSLRQMPYARIGDPVDMRNHGLKFSLDPLPTAMHISRGP